MHEEVTPERIYGSRERGLEQASDHIANMMAAKRQKGIWRDGQKYLALAPVAASSVAVTTKLEHWDGTHKGYLLIASAIGSAVLATIAEQRQNRKSGEEGSEAIAAALIYHDLGLPSPPAVNEAIDQIVGPDSLMGKSRKAS